MKKGVKRLLIGVAVLFAVLLVAPSLLSGKIAAVVKSEANKMLTARLDFEKLNISLLRHFPNASLELKGLTLVGVERFEGDTIVAAERISVVVSPLSLLGDGGFEVKKVLLSSPRVHGHKLEDGTVNWDVMRVAERGEEVTTEEVAAEATPAEGGSSFSLALKDFRISDAVLRYEDDSTKMYASVDPLDLRLRGDLSADESELDLEVEMERVNVKTGVVTMLSEAELGLDAEVTADLKNNRYTLNDNTLRLNAIRLHLDGWAQLLENDELAMDIKARTDEVQFKELLSLIPAFYTKDFRSLTAGGTLALEAWAKGRMAGASLPAFALNARVKDGRFQYASLPQAVTNIQIAAEVSNPGGVMDKTEVDLSQFSLNMAGNSVAATFYGTNLISDPQLRASLKGDLDLAAIEKVYPLEDMELAGKITANLKAAGRMSDLERQRYEQLSASGTFVVEQMGLDMASLPPVRLNRAAATITPQAMTLGELTLTVGESDLAANGQLTNYLGWLLRDDKLSGRLYVKSELLNLNQLMESMASDASAEETVAEEQTATPTETPAGSSAIIIPKNLDLTLTTSLKKILFQQMTITDVEGGMRVADGALSLDKLALKLFEGQATASGRYSTANVEQPTFTLDLGLKEASFQQTFKELELIQKLVPLFAKTGGVYSMSMNLSTALDSTMSPVMSSVNASGQLSSAKIQLANIEVLNQLATMLKYDKLSRIEAENVLIKFAVKEGRVTTQPFDLKMGKTKMTLSG
ncbi:MAG: AsmA family protein, partial [Alistipes sp.]|nr:AsmA family protein [Alistipes sp.]